MGIENDEYSFVKKSKVDKEKCSTGWHVLQLVSALYITEVARVEDLVKACVEIKFILFIEKTDLVLYIYIYKYYKQNVKHPYCKKNFHLIPSKGHCPDRHIAAIANSSMAVTLDISCTL